MMDANSLDLVGRARFGIPKQAAAMLLAEFDASPRAKMEAVRRAITQYHLSAPMTEAFDPENQAELWRVRKAMYPTLYNYDAKKKPINFADDIVVAADRIPELIAYLDRLFSEKGWRWRSTGTSATATPTSILAERERSGRL